MTTLMKSCCLHYTTISKHKRISDNNHNKNHMESNTSDENIKPRECLLANTFSCPWTMMIKLNDTKQIEQSCIVLYLHEYVLYIYLINTHTTIITMRGIKRSSNLTLCFVHRINYNININIYIYI
jgi:hypothetical protein